MSPGTRLIITLIFMGLVLAASIVPGQARPGDSIFVWLVAATPTPVQKILHVVVYAALTLLWVWTLQLLQSKPLRLLIALGVAIAFGAAMEWYQTRVPGRFGTLADVALNAIGAIVGLLLALFLL